MTADELTAFVKKAMIKEYKEDLQRMRVRLFDKYIAVGIAGSIRANIWVDAITYEDMEITDEKLTELVKKAIVWQNRERISQMESMVYTRKAANEFVQEIREEIAQDIITWEDLEITDEKLTELVEKASQ